MILLYHALDTLVAASAGVRRHPLGAAGARHAAAHGVSSACPPGWLAAAGLSPEQPVWWPADVAGQKKKNEKHLR